MARCAVLVTGGAGYIGAHTAMRLSQAGFLPVVFDNLSNGYEDFVQWGPFEHGDVRDGSRLDEVIEKHQPVAIMHFAGLIEVTESVRTPQRFYDANVGGSIALLGAARRGGIAHIVFSSTCATYGEPVSLPVKEDHQQLPLNPYGHTKLLIEQMIDELYVSGTNRAVVLRYFNAAGADDAARIGESHRCESHAIPLALHAVIGNRPHFSIFGVDYDTRDGTAERDYVHVVDLADAHVLALRHLLAGGRGGSFNIGTGKGTTVRELLDEIEAVTERHCPTRLEHRRAGDAHKLVANADAAKTILGWEARLNLRDIVQSAWSWHSQRFGKLPQDADPHLGPLYQPGLTMVSLPKPARIGSEQIIFPGAG